MNPKRLVNIIFIAILAWAFYMRAPAVINHFKSQDQNAPDFTVTKIDNSIFKLNEYPKNLVVVFWATWCGPCEVELKRINKLISDKKIQPDDVLAISSAEDPTLVKETVKRKNYLFNVAVDPDSSVSKKFNITATPTVIFIDKNYVINWMTSGISPTLDYRITSFLK